MPASVQFVDIGGLVEGASTGEGLGNKFLANIREVDAIVFVLRAFEDDDVPGPSDPLEHLRIVEIELALADLETVENQIEKRRKAAKQDTLDRRRGRRRSAGPSRSSPRARRSTAATSTPSDRELLTPYFLLTNKPVLAVVNVGEDDLERIDEIDRAGRGRARRPRRGHRHVRAARGRGGPARRRRAGRDARGASGLGEGALPRFLHTAYHMLGLRTFLTTGEKESRAWTFRAGSKAPAVRRA